MKSNKDEATAVPRLTTEFRDLSLVGWYGSSYFLTLMAFQPAFGQLCTIFPVKNIYLASIVVFEAGSAISASAPTAVAFIVGRLISGAAGGGLWCGTLTLMGDAVPVNKRHLYVSIVTSMYGVASAAGPLLGGVFTDSPKLQWRFCFWVNIRKIPSQRILVLKELTSNSDWLRCFRYSFNISSSSTSDASSCVIVILPKAS